MQRVFDELQRRRGGRQPRQKRAPPAQQIDGLSLRERYLYMIRHHLSHIYERTRMQYNGSCWAIVLPYLKVCVVVRMTRRQNDLVDVECGVFNTSNARIRILPLTSVDGRGVVSYSYRARQGHLALAGTQLMMDIDRHVTAALNSALRRNGSVDVVLGIVRGLSASQISNNTNVNASRMLFHRGTWYGFPVALQPAYVEYEYPNNERQTYTEFGQFLRSLHRGPLHVAHGHAAAPPNPPVDRSLVSLGTHRPAPGMEWEDPVSYIDVPRNQAYYLNVNLTSGLVPRVYTWSTIERVMQDQPPKSPFSRRPFGIGNVKHLDATLI